MQNSGVEEVAAVIRPISNVFVIAVITYTYTQPTHKTYKHTARRVVYSFVRISFLALRVDVTFFLSLLVHDFGFFFHIFFDFLFSFSFASILQNMLRVVVVVDVRHRYLWKVCSCSCTSKYIPLELTKWRWSCLCGSFHFCQDLPSEILTQLLLLFVTFMYIVIYSTIEKGNWRRTPDTLSKCICACSM